MVQVPVEGVILQLTWVGRSLLLAVEGGYKIIVAGNRVMDIADHLTCPPLLGSIPSLGLGMVLWDNCMALITDGYGSAVRQPLTLPSQPLVLSQAGLFVVAVCEDAVVVFDRSTAAQVQSLDWSHDDAWVALNARLPFADDAAGKWVVVATSNSVLLLEPVALEQQVRHGAKWMLRMSLCSDDAGWWQEVIVCGWYVVF